jgi:hypothetical protein
LLCRYYNKCCIVHSWWHGCSAMAWDDTLPAQILPSYITWITESASFILYRFLHSWRRIKTTSKRALNSGMREVIRSYCDRYVAGIESEQSVALVFWHLCLRVKLFRYGIIHVTVEFEIGFSLETQWFLFLTTFYAH